MQQRGLAIPEMELRRLDILTINASGSSSIPESHSSASITRPSIFLMKFCRPSSTDSARNSRPTRPSVLWSCRVRFPISL